MGHTINFMLQGKGGVGKSFCCAALAQYLIAKSKPPRCFDTDPVNATFHGYAALNVQRFEIMEGDEIAPRSFDPMVEQLATVDADVIIDSGASSFLPLTHYLLSNDVFGLLRESFGHKVVVHTIVTGGQAMLDTLHGFASLARQLPADVSFVVWLNPFWGPIEHEGRGFEQLKAYKDNKDRISAVIPIPLRKADTFGRDVSELLARRLTFAEGIADKSLPIMARQRLTMYQRDLFAQLDNAGMVL
jgi:hypothetical protein